MSSPVDTSGRLGHDARMKIAVTGGRNHTPTETEALWFCRALASLGATEVHHGGATGADYGLSMIADAEGYQVVLHKAEWATYGKLSGPLRNRKMISKVETLLVFPGGRGTNNCKIAAYLTDVNVYCSYNDQDRF